MNIFLRKYILIALFFSSVSTAGTAQDLMIPSDDLRRESRFIEAQSKVIIGDPEGAIEIYQDLLKGNPNDDEAAFFMGKVYLSKKDVQNGIKYFSLALANEKNNAWYYIWAADAYLQNDQFDQATNTIEMLVRHFPDEKQYYDRLEYLYRDSKQYQKQLDLLNDMLERFGFHKNEALGKVQALSDLNRETEAVNLLEELSEKFPRDVFILNMLANVYQKTQAPDKARETFEKILLINPSDSRAHLAILDSGVKDSSPEGKIESLKPFFLNDKIDFDTKFSKIASYFLGDLKKIPKQELEMLLEASEWLLESHPNTPKALSLRADLFAQSGHNAEAAALYIQTVNIFPDNYMVWEQLLWSLKELHRWKDLRHYADEASMYFPNKAAVYFMKGEAEYQLGNAEEALFDLETSLSLGAVDPAIKSNSLGFMGLVTCQSDPKASEGYFSQAKNTLENNPNIDYYKSICLLQNNKWEEARTYIDAALKKVSDKPSYVLQKAEILHHSGQYQEALDQLLPLSEQTHYFPVFLWISKLYKQLDQPDQANSYEQKAITYGAPEQKQNSN